MNPRVFTRKTNAKGTVVYRNVSENKQVKEEDVPAHVLATLKEMPEGTKVPESAELADNAGQAPVAPQKGVATRTIEIDRNILINGVVYRGNQEITVPEEVAVELLRMNKEHNQYERNLVKKQDFSRQAEVRPQDVQTPPSQMLD